MEGPAVYSALEGHRDLYLKRARRSSMYTIPTLFPPTGFTASTRLPDPFQSVASEGIRSLASRLVETLWPHFKFFEVRTTVKGLARLKDAGATEEDIQRDLLEIENIILKEVTKGPFRAVQYRTMLHILVGGNASLVEKPEGGFKLVPLDRYVAQRDDDGNVLQYCYKVVADPRMDVRLEGDEPIEVFHLWEMVEGGDYLYTVTRGDSGEILHSEEKDKLTPGFLLLRGEVVEGESYGRGLIEMMYGDIVSLDGLQENLLDAAVSASESVTTVNPHGVTDIEDVSSSRNHDVIPGRVEDVGKLRFDKGQDLNFAYQMWTTLRQDIAKQLALGSSVQRDSERTTATEISFAAHELDRSLGGVFSLQAVENQVPHIRHAVVKARPLIGTLSPEIFELDIIGGTEGIGRAAQHQATVQFFQSLALHPNAAEAVLATDTYQGVIALAVGAGVDSKTLVLTREEFEQKLKEAQQRSMVDSLGGPAINALSKQQNDN